MTVRIPGFIIGLVVGFVFSYIALAIFTDLRIDRLRPFIEKGATEIATSRAILEYRNQERSLRDKITKQSFEELEVMKKKIELAKKVLGE